MSCASIPNTVFRAYEELARDGVIESRGNSGMYVAPIRQIYTRAERRRRIEAALRAFISEAVRLGYTPEELAAEVTFSRSVTAAARNPASRSARAVIQVWYDGIRE